jgi:hypothetical protein
MVSSSGEMANREFALVLPRYQPSQNLEEKNPILKAM